MTMKGTPYTLMLQYYYNLNITLYNLITMTLVEVGCLTLSAKMQSMYSTAPVDWVINKYGKILP